ncbi:MAG TPA: hypothetical protein VNO30_40095 [Kofleriaceae bacterium]|nr:hypothetical protein [Kofleriaceae bacterium]
MPGAGKLSPDGRASAPRIAGDDAARRGQVGAPPRDRAKDALAILRAYAWPGNVRELRNAIERAVVVTSGALIGAGDLPVRVREARGPDAASAPAERARPAGRGILQPWAHTCATSPTRPLVST